MIIIQSKKISPEGLILVFIVFFTLPAPLL